MCSANIIYGVAIIAFCLISQIAALKCYSCNSRESCNKPQLVECTSKLADETIGYLQQNHTLANSSATSPNFDCFRETIRTSSAWTYHKGCVYSNTDVCTLPIVTSNSSSLKVKECYECNNKDACNPAGCINIDVLSVLMTLFVAVGLRL